MPTAPTLNRPPKLVEPKTSSFASPGTGTGWDKPPSSGNNPNLVNAAVNTAVRSNTSGTTPVTKGQPDTGVTKVPRPPAATSTNPAGITKGQPDTGVTATPRPPSDTAPTGSTPTVSSPGAPPGVPDTSFTIPQLPQDEATIQGANQDYSNSVAAANLGMGQAAFAYGDPTQMQRFGVGSINPNSALALAALKAQQDQEAATNARARAGTLFSSLALQDRAKIGSAQQRADLLGNTKYQASLAKFNTALIDAQTARDKSITGAQADERAAALKNLPTANTASGGVPSTTATGSRSIATKGGKGQPTAKATKVPKTSTTVPKVSKGSKASKGSSSVKAVGKVTIQKPPKVGGRK